MKIQFYNTLTDRVQEFNPIDPWNVRLYVCGPTVYDRIHVGNARPLVVFDVLVRLLRRHFHRVTYVRNITDVDDKIYERAVKNNESIYSLTERTIATFRQDCRGLNTLKPNIEPRATDHIEQMKKMISVLMKDGHAYLEQDHVLFDVSRMETYGQLSKRSQDELVAGARVEVAPYKRNPADFVLWKPSSGNQPGWNSDWGYGRPGWHIECSAMSAEYLGKRFDIHGGGLDLVFPHHENEIAQSCCAHHNDEMARFWIHNGYVTVDGEKMAKSKGNFKILGDVLTKHSKEAVRLALLSSHYRAPLDFSVEKIKEATVVLRGLYRAIEKIELPARRGWNFMDKYVLEALNDDLNTPKAIMRLRELSSIAQDGDLDAGVKLKSSARYLLGLLKDNPANWVGYSANEEIDSKTTSYVTQQLKELTTLAMNGDTSAKAKIRLFAKFLGASEDEVEEWFSVRRKYESPEVGAAIWAAAFARREARKNKDFAEADFIREILLELGIHVEDLPGGGAYLIPLSHDK